MWREQTRRKLSVKRKINKKLEEIWKIYFSSLSERTICIIEKIILFMPISKSINSVMKLMSSNSVEVLTQSKKVPYYPMASR